MDMHNAIKNSCDTYFYHLSNRAGVDRIARVAETLGFGHTFQLGISGQSAGTVPSTEWKREYTEATSWDDDPTWYPGETLILGIGQGYMQTTPLQLAQAPLACRA